MRVVIQLPRLRASYEPILLHLLDHGYLSRIEPEGDLLIGLPVKDDYEVLYEALRVLLVVLEERPAGYLYPIYRLAIQVDVLVGMDYLKDLLSFCDLH